MVTFSPSRLIFHAKHIVLKAKKTYWMRILYTIVLVSFACYFIVKMHHFIYNSYDIVTLLNAYPLPHTFWHDPTDSTTSPTAGYTNRTALKEMSVVITACCRDVELLIPDFRKNIEQLVTVFKRYQILLGESDSADHSLNLLRQWSQEDSNVKVYSYGSLRWKLSRRTERIAYCRNDLLRVVQTDPILKTSDFYFVMDVDRNADITLTMDNFLTNFAYPLHSWAVMTASQLDCYYDIWALRSTVVTYDCWRVVDRFWNRQLAARIFVGIHQKPIPIKHKLIQVFSAFGGFGIYQTRFLKNCTYSGYSGKHEVCEHVSFHQCICRNGGVIFINPAFLNSPIGQNSDVCIEQNVAY